MAKVVTVFDRVCIPADCVAPRSHTPGMLPLSALSGGRSPDLGTTWDFRHGLIGSAAATRPECLAEVALRILRSRCAPIQCSGHISGGSESGSVFAPFPAAGPGRGCCTGPATPAVPWRSRPERRRPTRSFPDLSLPRRTNPGHLGARAPIPLLADFLGATISRNACSRIPRARFLREASGFLVLGYRPSLSITEVFIANATSYPTRPWATPVLISYLMQVRAKKFR